MSILLCKACRRRELLGRLGRLEGWYERIQPHFSYGGLRDLSPHQPASTLRSERHPHFEALCNTNRWLIKGMRHVKLPPHTHSSQIGQDARALVRQHGACLDIVEAIEHSIEKLPLVVRLGPNSYFPKPPISIAWSRANRTVFRVSRTNVPPIRMHESSRHAETRETEASV